MWRAHPLACRSEVGLHSGGTRGDWDPSAHFPNQYTFSTTTSRRPACIFTRESSYYEGSCASCSDEQLNGDETSEDCGGSCPPCPGEKFEHYDSVFSPLGALCVLVCGALA